MNVSKAHIIINKLFSKMIAYSQVLATVRSFY